MDIAKKLTQKKNHGRLYLGMIGIICLIFFLPLYFRPDVITNRGNDLSEEFLPLFSYVKKSIWKYHQFPLWQNIVLSGSPILGDPQNPWIYPPYLLVLFLPLDYFALVAFTLHFFLAGIFTYLLLRSFRFSQSASFSGGLVYMLAPKLVAHLEAGHLGMVAAFSLAPLFFLSARKITDKKSFLWPVLFGISAAWMVMTYFTVFYYALIVVVCMVGWHILTQGVKGLKRRNGVRSLVIRILIAFLVMVGISLPHLLAGSEFLPLSNRENLTFFDIAQPVWSLKKFISALFFPFAGGFNSWQTEEVLFPGFIPLIVSAIGFIQLPRRLKLLTLCAILIVVLISLNTRTPLYGFIYRYLPGMKYLRITTRLWFIATLVIAFLFAVVIDSLGKMVQSFKRLNLIVLFFLTFELSIWGYLRLQKSHQKSMPLPKAFQQIIDKDPTYFRLYCTTGCIPLGKDAPEGKGNVGGYNPVHLSSYDSFLARAGGYSFAGFAPILPPYQTYGERPQPSAELLGYLNTRFVISTYPLLDTAFRALRTEERYIFYENSKRLPYASWHNKEGKIMTLSTKITPNRIEIDTGNLSEGEIVVSELFYPAWKAETAKGESIPIQRKNGIILSIPLTKAMPRLILGYTPKGMPYSIKVMLFTYGVCGLYIFRNLLTRLPRS